MKLQAICIPTVEIKAYIFVVDGRNFFDKPIRNDLKTFNNIKKIPTGEGDDYTSEFLPDYLYFKKNAINNNN